MSGKAIRLKRIFKDDGKTVISALDFGGFMGPVPGLEVPRDIVGKVVAGGADAIIVNPGFAREAADVYGGKVGLIMRSMAAPEILPDGSNHVMIVLWKSRPSRSRAVCVMVILVLKKNMLCWPI